MNMERVFLAIDLKSFYASVECVERGLDPLTTNLVVADASRTEKTICLAVSPTLKAYGISGRARLFEVEEKVREVNDRRKRSLHGKPLSEPVSDDLKVQADPAAALGYITATPQMSKYMAVSNRIYQIYLKYVSSEDIHVYSIDEVFMDVTAYLSVWKMTPRELAMKMIHDVLSETGITATAGIGTNLYLCKIAMDIVAKHIPADRDGVRIAELDEMGYRRLLWEHTPLTDFWRVGKGYVKKLNAVGLETMGDIARCSLGSSSDFYNEDLLYKLFGINAELLIDHAWGWEPCTIREIKAYRPEEHSISSGQVLSEPYSFGKGLLILREMTDLLALDLVDRDLVTDQIVLTVGYDISCLTDPAIRKKYKGPVTADYYGREVPKPAHGSVNLGGYTSSVRMIMEAVTGLYEKTVHKDLLVRRMYVVANHVLPAKEAGKEETFEQLDLFTDYRALEARKREKQQWEEKELRAQKAALKIKKKYGKNAVLKGMNFEEGATTIERNRQVGGHRA